MRGLKVLGLALGLVGQGGMSGAQAIFAPTAPRCAVTKEILDLSKASEIVFAGREIQTVLRSRSDEESIFNAEGDTLTVMMNAPSGRSDLFVGLNDGCFVAVHLDGQRP